VAKKARTPPPPRRAVQAPRTRSRADEPHDRRVWLIAIGAGALGFVGIAAVLALYAFSGDGGGRSAAAALDEAGCTLTTYVAQGRNHVQQLPKNFKYNSFPPTSGPHHPQPAPFDVYEDPVEQFRLVHNLEHGGVVIQYGRRVPEQTVNEIVRWYRGDPNGIVIAPLPALGAKIALAAWNADVDASGASAERGQGLLALCTRFDEGAFDAFMDAYAFKGPERFPKDALAPGL
jgi:hypothetical protein